MTTPIRLGSVSLDCPDASALARFYATLLGAAGAYDSEGFAALHLDGTWPSMQKVEDYRPPTWPEPEVPQQAHLDFAVADLQAAEEAALDAGATTAATQPAPDRWRVLFDPAGPPFCLTTQIRG